MEELWNDNQSRKYIGGNIFPQNALFSKLFSINYYIILNDDNKEKSDLILEMKFNLKKSLNSFVFYCFVKISKQKKKNLFNEYYYIVNNEDTFFQEYLLLCFEGNCYIFDIEANDFEKNLIFLLNNDKEIVLIGSRNDDISRFHQIFDLKHDSMKEIDKNLIESKTILLIEKSYINEIELDINTIMNESLIIGLNNQLKHSNQSIYHIIKLLSFRIVMTYSIRRFYFPINLFSDPSFFGREKEFFDITNKNYKIVSDSNQKYTPQKNILMKEMNIKDFLILRTIGKGSSATIYLAFHIHEEKLFVMKRFNESIYFEIEKNNYLRLNFYHPNIIKCYGYTKDCLIIEFMSNGTLQNMIKLKSNQNSPYFHYSSQISFYISSSYFQDLNYNFFNNNSNKVKMIIEIIFGLQYLHLNDMIYCDMKPDNIFIDHNFMIRLGDFDLSCNNDLLSTKSNKIKNIGSINYFSPDILFNETEYYSYISDIFQLGLIIYAICVGEDLFKNISFDDSKQINKTIKNKSIPFIFGPFCTIFNKCLKTLRINRMNLCDLIIELSQYKQFFSNLSRENHANFFYNDIVIVLQMLHQNLYEIFVGLINLFYDEILNENACVNKRNIRQYEFVLNHLFMIPSLKNMRNKLSKHIQTIIQFIEKKITNADANTKQDKRQIEFLKKQFYRTLYLIYSDKEFCLYNIQKSTEYLLLGVKNNDTLSQNLVALKFYDGNEIFKKNLINSIVFFTLSAESGSENAQYNLGEIYSHLYESPIRLKIPQFNIDTNDQLFFANQALKYYKLAKKQNSSAALYALSVIYNNGDLGLKKNKNKAIKYLTRSKKHFYQISINSFLAFFSVGLIYSNYDFALFEKEATFLSDSFNNVVAQFELGNFYLKQIKDIEKAKKYFKLAGEKNHRIALTSLANIYLDESKRKKSIEIEKIAFNYFYRAANLNEPNALYYVACRYFIGDKPYIKIDYKKALDFFQRAFVLNSPKAQNFLGYIFLKGCRPYVEPNNQKAIYCYKLAAENPIRREKDAMDILGLIYLEGIIVRKDVKIAFKYFKNAKNLRSQLSIHQLGFLYEIGEKRFLNNLDFIQNVFFTSEFQIYNLTFCHIANLNDRELNEDDSIDFKSLPDLAIQYYTESLSPPSMYNLAAMYYSGIYVNRNVFFAIDLLKKIAKFLKFAAFFLFRIFSTGEPDLITIDDKNAVYYLNLSGISPLNNLLTIDFLKNSRFFYKMIYNKDECKKTDPNLQKNIDDSFYEGLLLPKIQDSLFDEYYNHF